MKRLTIKHRHSDAAIPMAPLSALLIGLLLITGCGSPGGTAAPAETEEAPLVSQAAAGTVIAEAAIEPARSSELIFTVGGTVEEVLVAPGDEVGEGGLLARLDVDDLELAVQEAEAALASARAQLAQVKAGSRPEEIAEAESQISDAQAALSQAAAQRDQITAGVTEAEIAAAQAELTAAQAQQRQVMEETRGAREQKTDEDARKQADYRFHAANQSVAAAQARLAAAQGGAEARLRDAQSGVWLAAAQRDVAQAELALLQAGATSEQIGVSEAAVQQAEVALAAARAALDDVEIRAPFAGTVTKVDVEVGETASPGLPVIILAALDQLQALTIDLTELDVARVAVGQPVEVTVDALPDLTLEGHVAEIGLRAVDYRGDVTYPVTIALDETTPELLWGMTAMVKIDTD